MASVKTAESIAALWRRPCPGAAGTSYAAAFSAHAKLRRWTQAPQELLPARAEKTGELLHEISAPGGHGFFGFRALLAAARPQLRPATAAPLVAMICNGEDASPKPLAELSGWMVREAIPLVMITTTKTAVDSKGGQIALVAGAAPEDTVSATIIELAQAEQAGQKDLFLQLGLRPDDQPAYFNTNTVLINYHALAPLLEELYRELGSDEFCRVIAPTLMHCSKERRDEHGQLQRYSQVEGALGSVMLNLDRYWRQRFGLALVHFVNVSVEDRLEFFAPVKSAFDFYRLFYSDCFRFAGKDLRFVPQSPSVLPQVQFSDPAYRDLEVVMRWFAGSRIAQLTSLRVEGLVDFSNCVLVGAITISNFSGAMVRLSELSALTKYWQGNHLLLQDLSVLIPAQGGVVAHAQMLDQQAAV